MINAEKLLGGLLRQTLTGGRRRNRRRRRRQSGWGSLLGGGLTGAAGMGILGVAIAAYEHFSQKSSSVAAAAQPAAVPPPTPPAATPPPPPGSTQSAVPPPAPAATPSPENNKTALLLIQAMIAAANADGDIDPEEEREILDRLNEAGMTLEEREFILKQLAAPPNPESLLSQVDTPELARQFYAVSLMAIVVDTELEEAYLSRLRSALGLDEAAVKELHAEFGGVEE